MARTGTTGARQGRKPPYSWQPSETAQLIAGYEQGRSLGYLSELTGRSPHHVVVQLAWVLCGVGRDDMDPLAPRFREPWNEAEHRALVHWHTVGVSIQDIAHHLERDVSDVAWRLVTERECRWLVSRVG